MRLFVMHDDDDGNLRVRRTHHANVRRLAKPRIAPVGGNQYGRVGAGAVREIDRDRVRIGAKSADGRLAEQRDRGP